MAEKHKKNNILWWAEKDNEYKSFQHDKHLLKKIKGGRKGHGALVTELLPSALSTAQLAQARPAQLGLTLAHIAIVFLIPMPDPQEKVFSDFYFLPWFHPSSLFPLSPVQLSTLWTFPFVFLLFPKKFYSSICWTYFSFHSIFRSVRWCDREAA